MRPVAAQVIPPKRFLEFAKPPGNSAGKMPSAISGLRRQLSRLRPNGSIPPVTWLCQTVDLPGDNNLTQLWFYKLLHNRLTPL